MPVVSVLSGNRRRLDQQVSAFFAIVHQKPEIVDAAHDQNIGGWHVSPSRFQENGDNRPQSVTKIQVEHMADCCSSSDCKTAHPNRHRCPANGVEYAEVPARTIAHHIEHPWQWGGKAQRYFFCDDPACEVVYFGEDDSVILKSQLRTAVGVKETIDEAMLCYCFGVTRADALNDSGIRDFVVAQTKLGLCSCDTSNPSGRCCLKDFPRKGESA